MDLVYQSNFSVVFFPGQVTQDHKIIIFQKSGETNSIDKHVAASGFGFFYSYITLACSCFHLRGNSEGCR